MTDFFIPFNLTTSLPKVPAVKGTKRGVNTYRIDYEINIGFPNTKQKFRKFFSDYKSFALFCLNDSLLISIGTKQKPYRSKFQIINIYFFRIILNIIPDLMFF